MSETRDLRIRGDLDLFLLALIESGLSTPYEFKNAAGLSPGATIPALRRLVEQGFAAPGAVGPRGRIKHRITAAGKRLLKTGWKELIDQGPSGDLDADLRIALLTLAVGGDRRSAVDFLAQSAQIKRAMSETLEQPPEPQGLPPIALWYRRLRSAAAQVTAQAEASAIQEIAETLPARARSRSHQSNPSPERRGRR